MADLRYPIGEFRWDGELTAARRAQWTADIAAAPAAFAKRPRIAVPFAGQPRVEYRKWTTGNSACKVSAQQMRTAAKLTRWRPD